MHLRTPFAVSVRALGTGREKANVTAAPPERIAGQAPTQHGIEGMTILFPFSLANSEGPSLSVKIIQPQPNHLTHSQPGGISKIQHRTMLQIVRCLNDADDFLLGKEIGKFILFSGVDRRLFQKAASTPHIQETARH
ncbi:hypothetical protein D3C76_687060 [compost metagenome]